jgi:hypothetical protein
MIMRDLPVEMLLLQAQGGIRKKSAGDDREFSNSCH